MSVEECMYLWTGECVANIMVRGDLSVEDPLKTYWLLGDLAARAFFCHIELETIQLERYK